MFNKNKTDRIMDKLETKGTEGIEKVEREKYGMNYDFIG